MHLDSRILITGGSGLVGSALDYALQQRGFEHVYTTPSHKAVDLRVWKDVREWFTRPYQFDYVFHCAARVGGIGGNAKAPGGFIHDNILINTNVIEASRQFGVKKLLFLGSACAYPKYAPVPIRETSLLCGELEPSNRAYAIAKIAGIEMCDAYRQQYGCNFISALPTNLYGPNDDYDLETSHVIPGMIRRMHEAKLAGRDVHLWGDGSPKREFLFADDFADACIHLMDHYDGLGPINVGSGVAHTLKWVAWQVADVVGFPHKIYWDTTKPNGTPDRTLDNSRMRELGWKPATTIKNGLAAAYRDFLKRYGN